MKEIKLKLSYDQWCDLERLLKDQVVDQPERHIDRVTRILACLLAEIWKKLHAKSMFPWDGTRSIKLTEAQGRSLHNAIYSGWFESPNKWTHTCLQTHLNHIDKQLHA